MIRRQPTECSAHPTTDASRPFVPRDRVRIDGDWIVTKVAGHTRTVAAYPTGCSCQPNCMWIELDLPNPKPGETDGAEVDVVSVIQI